MNNNAIDSSGESGLHQGEGAVFISGILMSPEEISRIKREARRAALLEAAAEVRSHWNHHLDMVRAKDQAARSAAVLENMARRESP